MCGKAVECLISDRVLLGRRAGAGNVHCGIKNVRIGYRQGRSVDNSIVHPVGSLWVRRKLLSAAAKPKTSEQVSFVDYINEYSSEFEAEPGFVTIRLMTEVDVPATAVCLTRGFSGTPEAVTLQSAREYFEEMLLKLPDAVVVVATILPQDKSLLPEGKTERLIGTASLSFTRKTRETYDTLQPSDESAFLLNMAVDREFRRQGIARYLLSCCEEISVVKGLNQMSLHVRLADPSARALYTTSGFSEQDRDFFLSSLRGMRPRALLGKEL